MTPSEAKTEAALSLIIEILLQLSESKLLDLETLTSRLERMPVGGHTTAEQHLVRETLLAIAKQLTAQHPKPPLN